MKYLFHVTPIENLDAILKEGLVPQVGVRSAKLNEHPAVFLFTNRESLENALENWLGDEFEDVEENGLVILKLDARSVTYIASDAEYEVISCETIKPETILAILNENFKTIKHPLNKKSDLTLRP